MADPRAAVSYEGINGVYATFKTDNSTILFDKTKSGGSAQVGLAVTLSTDDTVALAADAEAVKGKLVSVESDNFCTVQIGGGMTLPGGTGATLTVGVPVVGALLVAAKGYVRAAASGAAAELLVARGEIINNDDTTKVVIML